MPKDGLEWIIAIGIAIAIAVWSFAFYMDVIANPSKVAF